MSDYLRVVPAGLGSRVEVHQLVRNDREARFMTVAWSLVLGRWHAGFTDPDAPGRLQRGKRR